MENSINNFNSVTNTIRGSYSPVLNWNIFDFPINNNISYKEELINEYIEEKKYLEKQIYEIEVNNINLLNNIYFFNKRCNYINITHSNTINFIIAHYRELKHILDKLIYIYNKNIYNINLLNEKIYEINMMIYNLKENIYVKV